MVIFFYQDSIEIEKIKDVLKKKNLLSSLETTTLSLIFEGSSLYGKKSSIV